ncbi:MAG: TetR/AcrR family transcriptional regulator [Alphaproteobacteria bacterium]|nr:TetR/AcrR family transcriptional regulator [Alphaproteobacteria bacterium]
MGRPPKNTKPLTADEITAAALKQLDLHGEKAVTFRQLAQYFNVTPMAIAHHVGTRDQLFNRIAAQIYQDTSPEINDQNSLNALKNSLERYCQKVISHPQLTHYIFANPTLIANSLDILTHQITQYLAQMIDDEIQIKILLGVIIDYTHGFAISTAAYQHQDGQTIKDYQQGLNWILSKIV